VETAVDGAIVKGLQPLYRTSQKVGQWDDTLELRIFYPALNKMIRFSHTAAYLDDLATPKFFEPTINAMTRFAKALATFDEKTTGRFAGRIARSANLVRDGIYNGWLWIIRSIEGYGRFTFRRLFFSIIKVDYDHKNETFFQKISMMNLDVNFIIILIILLITLGTGFLVILI